MHPAFYHWWKHSRRGSSCNEGPDARDAQEAFGDRGGFGPFGRGHDGPGDDRERGFGGFGRGRHGHFPGHGPGHGPGFGGGPGAESRFGGPDDASPFGVRRPLRFLANKLDLTEEQVGTLARVLNELKTERAQSEVDHQRTVAAFADAAEADTFDAARAEEGGKLRAASAERLNQAVVKALARIHGMLTKEQREKFAYLVRTGIVSM